MEKPTKTSIPNLDATQVEALQELIEYARKPRTFAIISIALAEMLSQSLELSAAAGGTRPNEVANEAAGGFAAMAEVLRLTTTITQP